VRIAVVGGGQLGRMLGLAGIPLGMSFRFLDPDPACPASAVGEVVAGRFDDRDALGRLVAGCDVATYEFENVPASVAEFLAGELPTRPGPRSLAIAQDRVLEKRFFAECGVPVQEFAAIDGPADLDAAAGRVGFPAMLKTRRMGYDGKGQRRVAGLAEAKAAFTALGGVPCILEAFVPFTREASAIVVRSNREAVAYGPVENEHVGGILRQSRTRAGGLPEATLRHAHAVAERLGHVGTLAVEFFVLADGGVVANEMAPRVHNSGHWTIEGATASQFENHLRAIAGLPLGETSPRGSAGMVNIIGAEPDAADVLRLDGVHLHRYGKAPRPGRKLGHATIVAANDAELDVRLAELRRLVDAARPEAAALPG
jgi:5-(carboxyamino)imidazole ribonucleotide synthase